MSDTGKTCCQHGTPTENHCFLCCKDVVCRICERLLESSTGKNSTDKNDKIHYASVIPGEGVGWSDS